MTTTTAFVNYYEILEISPQATTEQIKAAVKLQRRTWIKRQQAPSIERQREAEDRVRMIDAAETTLLDADARAEFDRRLASYVPPATPALQPTAEGTTWLVRAKEFLSAGDVRSAAYAARQATDQQASHHEAWAVRATADFLIGQVNDAIFEFKEAIRIKPDEDSYYFDLGSVYESKSDNAEAIRYYQQAAQLAPDKPVYKVAIASVMLSNNRPEEALPILEQVHKDHPEVEEFAFYLAAALNEATLKGWTPVKGARVVTKAEQIGTSRDMLTRASKLAFESPELRTTIAANLSLVEWAAAKHFRVPGFTAALKTSKSSASTGGCSGMASGCAGVGCLMYAGVAIVIAIIAGAFKVNPILGILALAAAGTAAYLLAWRPGWKWNQIDARGVTVTRAKSVGTHAQGRD
jgi:tetratricopeptide (TPR) repeat protein